MDKDLLCGYCNNQSMCQLNSQLTCELFEPSDSITVLISTNELLDKLADKNAYEKMTVHAVRELIMSCNKIFCKDPPVRGFTISCNKIFTQK